MAFNRAVGDPSDFRKFISSLVARETAVALAPCDRHQRQVNKPRINGLPQVRVGDGPLPHLCIRADLLPTIVLPDVPPAIAAADRIRGIRPKGYGFFRCILLDPLGGIEESNQLHCVVGCIQDSAESGCDLSRIPIRNISPATSPAARFARTVCKDIQNEGRLLMGQAGVRSDHDIICFERRPVAVMGSSTAAWRRLESRRARRRSLPRRPLSRGWPGWPMLPASE